MPEYWIQTGSYRSESRAQEAAANLADQGLAPQMTTQVVAGQTFHRVRVGPYASNAEARKFLGWIRKVKGLEDSYVSLVYASRTAP